VNVNPVSYMVSGVRSMANDGMVTSQVGWALLGCAAVVAVFLPLAVRSYKRML
jgi:ABC-2 type transport system permease protein